MEIRIDRKPLAEIETDALVLAVFEPEEGAQPVLPTAARGLGGGWFAYLVGAGEFKGKTAESATLHKPAGIRAQRLVVFGAGKAAKFTATQARKLAGSVLRALKSRGYKQIALVLPDGCADAGFVTAAAEGALLGDYNPDRYLTDKKDVKTVDAFVLAATPAPDEAAEAGRILGEAQNFTRTLANEPGNLLTPRLLAEQASRMASDYGLDCEVLDQEQMQVLGFGALLGVAQGSAQPPAFIVIRYQPAHPIEGVHLGLVGKGVTFDSGGISIKPSEGMEKMRYDMSGGAAVLGALRAIAQLKPNVTITGFIPAVENMPSGRAQRPGDIVTSLSGKTIEVLNTDAEGRLILADAITYAKRQGCTHLIDAATLTGAIVVALGHIHVGLFSNNQEFSDRVLAAGRAEGETAWPLPLDEEYREYLKSDFADLANVGGRWGGSVTAAYFLKEFAEETPWVHLDIAGTAWLEKGEAWLAKGPSGTPMRTFCRLALDWK
jgi:leucyl aminopeptidase